MAFCEGGLFSKFTGLGAGAGVGRATGSFTEDPPSKARFRLKGQTASNSPVATGLTKRVS